MPTALMTVSNKEHLIPLAQFLDNLGWSIIATSGTRHCLQRLSTVRSVDVSFVTNYEPLLGGQVKVMHPKILGGILMGEKDNAQADKYFFNPIDLVVVNFYPFMDAVQNGASDDDGIRNIDIGGPTLVHAAVKNCARVTVLVDPDDYQIVMDEIAMHSNTLSDTRRSLALKAERYALNYHSAVYHWHKSKMSAVPATPDPYKDFYAGGKFSKNNPDQ